MKQVLGEMKLKMKLKIKYTQHHNSILIIETDTIYKHNKISK